MITQSKSEYATPQDYWRLFSRHKTKSIAAFAITLSAAVALAFLWPRTYKSESKLFVHVGRETVTLDPTATTGQLIPVSLSTETEVNSVIEKLVDEIGPGAILRPSATTAATTTSSERSPSVMSRLVSLVDVDPVSDREQAINRLAKRLESAIEKKSDVITISGTAESPELAQKIVAKFVDIYFGEHARMHRTTGSQGFFTEQKALLRKGLDEASEKLRDAKNELGIVSIDSQRQVLQEETISVENRLAQSRSALAASQDKVEALREKLTGLPERLMTDEVQGFPNVAADNMRNELYQLEIKEAELASRFNDQFPALVAVRAQIEAAKKPLNKEEHRRTQQTTGVNLVHDQLQVSLLSEESNLASLDAECKSLDNQLAQLGDRARNLNQSELKIANLEQEVSLCKANYATYSEKSEQSRIDAALQNEQITNVNVIQPASLVAKPVSPHKAALLALGLIGGLLLGVGAALVAEYLDPSFEARDGVESRPGLLVRTANRKVADRQAVLN
jgi:uncharacterized protein involved in exopolysaccharide biosynthesis